MGRSINCDSLIGVKDGSPIYDTPLQAFEAAGKRLKRGETRVICIPAFTVTRNGDGTVKVKPFRPSPWISHAGNSGGCVGVYVSKPTGVPELVAPVHKNSFMAREHIKQIEDYSIKPPSWTQPPPTPAPKPTPAQEAAACEEPRPAPVADEIVRIRLQLARATTLLRNLVDNRDFTDARAKEMSAFLANPEADTNRWLLSKVQPGKH